jgi:hypothetical protein
MQDELQAIQNSATRVWDLVLKRFAEMSPLVVALFSATDLIEGRIDAVAANEVHWGVQQALMTVLSHFPKLELLEAFWTQTYRALESLSLGVPPSIAHSPPDGTGEDSGNRLAIFVFLSFSSRLRDSN